MTTPYLLREELDSALLRIRQAGTDLHDIEVKSASKSLPRTTIESVSAFANTEGGLLILGISEELNFKPVSIDAAKIAADLASACTDQLEPPIRPIIDILQVDGHPVVVARVDELSAIRKPCHVKTRGIESGSFLRSHDGDRRMTSYEVHILGSARGQPIEDTSPIENTSIDDLDQELLQSLIRRLRETRSQSFRQCSDAQILQMVGVTAKLNNQTVLSLAGLLALGRYPQQFFPQLNITLTVSPTLNAEPLADGTRFLDNVSIDGSIPAMVSDALNALRRNMKRRSIVVGSGREDRWEYPGEAIREVVANALMHRDYHSLARGTQVRITLFPDRLEFASPGGLHGVVAKEDLLSEVVTSSRNAHLAKLLEDVAIPGTGRTVCENRGSGLLATAAALRHAGIEPPKLKDSVREFQVVFRNHGLLDDAALEWLDTINTEAISDRQKLGLAYLRRYEKIDNAQYRTITGCDAYDATRDLVELARNGLARKLDNGRGAVWHLSANAVKTPGLHYTEVSPERHSPKRADRRVDILKLLSTGARSTRELAGEIGIQPKAVLSWLRKLEKAGDVRTTLERRTDPRNRWQLCSTRGTKTS